MRWTAVIFCAVVAAGCARNAESSLVPVVSSDGATVAPPVGVYRVLFSFNYADGNFPTAGLIYYKGALYGTTASGGADSSGVFFKFAAGKEKTLYDFGSHSGDGLQPQFGPLIESGGVFYGTTYAGGAHSQGTVFRITPAGAEKVIYSFKGANDGANPEAGVIAVNGVLYGTTVSGGGNCSGNFCGTVFRVTTAGKETVLYRFKGGKDGIGPAGGLTYVKGKLYGTTNIGGAGGIGTVFEFSRTHEKVLHTFEGTFSKDGHGPTGNLTDVKGVLYGTTTYGGAYGSGSGTSGTVYAIATSGAYKVIYSFKGPDGGYPLYTTLVDVKGVLYGTTNLGGANNNGTVFAVTKAGGERVLHSFKGGKKDGAMPYGGPIPINGKLYGVASRGGTFNDGIIYVVTQ